MSYGDIIDSINELKNKEDLYRIKLHGTVDRDINLDTDDLTKAIEENFYYIDIIDNTIIDYDLEILEREM